MVSRTRMTRQKMVMMPKKRLSLMDKFLISYLNLGDRVIEKVIKGKLSEKEKRDLVVLEKEFPDRASIVSTYLTRR